jgi:hypothetical protein
VVLNFVANQGVKVDPPADESVLPQILQAGHRRWPLGVMVSLRDIGEIVVGAGWHRQVADIEAAFGDEAARWVFIGSTSELHRCVIVVQCSCNAVRCRLGVCNNATVREVARPRERSRESVQCKVA